MTRCSLQEALNPRRAAGAFTLVELLCVLAIVAVLSMVGLPLYSQAYLALGRLQAVTALREVHQRQHTYFAEHHRYADALTGLGYKSDPFAIDLAGKVRKPDAGDRIYLIDLVTRNGAYTVTAQPQSRQGKDTLCGSLSLRADGTSGVSGTADLKQCWR